MGREGEGGFRMGNTCTPVADSCQCMAKPLQYCKVISLQLIKINEKKTRGKKNKNIKWSLQDKTIQYVTLEKSLNFPESASSSVIWELQIIYNMGIMIMPFKRLL